ncbi:MAG: RluA family pseudouridine synthase [Alphaproteobacteria bacterium]|nr:RluA family pseudouridine synthase [Alphaproteobacteria bacterium]
MDTIETLKIIASMEDHGQRLDRVLASHAPQVSRSRFQGLIVGGHISPARDSSYKVKEGDVFYVTIPPAEEAVPKPQKIAIDVVYEDDDLLVVNKSANMVVHPAAGNRDGTLVNALLAHCGDRLSGIGGVKRPGIVHRLDKETSGLMVVAKNDIAHHGLSEQLAARTLKRVYQAIVFGAVSPSSGRIETQIGRSKTNRKKMAVLASGGRTAVTYYKKLEGFGMMASLVECRLETGRTHQIRVHLAHIRHWLVGDPVYGRGSVEKFLRLNKADPALFTAMLGFPRQALHAVALEFIHPISKDRVRLTAELPEDMQGLLCVLRKTGQER